MRQKSDPTPVAAEKLVRDIARNETAGALEVLNLLSLEDCIVTADALHCHRARLRPSAKIRLRCFGVSRGCAEAVPCELGGCERGRREDASTLGPARNPLTRNKRPPQTTASQAAQYKATFVAFT
jgi:predicted transposase YbfD/YdcC